MEKIFKNDEWVAEIWLIKRDFAIIARDKSFIRQRKRF